MDISPKHPTRVIEATELGEIAGREYQLTADQQCPPEDWTEERIAQWCGLLREIRENPYTEGQFPYADATPEQNAKYAETWKQAFKMGRHAVQAESRRAAA